MIIEGNVTERLGAAKKKAAKKAAPKKKAQFLPGLKKAVKKVGKFTAPITTAVARTILPESVIKAAAAIDPTKRKVTPAAVQTATTTLVQERAAELEKQAETTEKSDKLEALKKTLTNPAFITAAGLGAVLLIMTFSRRK